MKGNRTKDALDQNKTTDPIKKLSFPTRKIFVTGRNQTGAVRGRYVAGERGRTRYVWVKEETTMPKMSARPRAVVSSTQRG